MALLFMDGFDHYATADITKKWTTIATGTPVITTNGRRSGSNWQNASGTGNGMAYISKALPTSIATGVIGFAYYCNSLPSSDLTGLFLHLVDTSAFHVQVGIDNLGGIFVARGGTINTLGTVLGRSAGGVITVAGYHYLEVKATIHDTTGAVTVRLNGVAILTITGVDTRNGGNATFNGFWIGSFSAAGSIHIRIDDLYVCDTSGSTNNDFLGDVRIDTIFPTSDGNYTQFTPSTGVSHFALVDETAPNTSDYNEGVTVGDRDSYGMGNLSALVSQTIYGVQVNAAALKDDAGAKSVATFVRSSSTNSDGAAAVLSTAQVYVSQVFETDPNGSIAWTESSVNAMEAGVKVV